MGVDWVGAIFKAPRKVGMGSEANCCWHSEREYYSAV